MPKMDLYYMPLSPPCRAVCLTARHLNVELNLKPIDLLGGEHRQPYFVKINPQHTIPTFVDGDLVIWESRAIMQYLANKFDEGGNLYPTDPKERAKVNMLLNFDMGTLYQRFMKYYVAVAFGTDESLDPAKKEKLEEALGFLETFLKNQTYVAGNHLTIADHSVATSVSTIKACDIFNLEKYTKITEWLSRCEREIPGYEDLSTESLNMLAQALKSRIEEKTQK